MPAKRRSQWFVRGVVNALSLAMDFVRIAANRSRPCLRVAYIAATQRPSFVRAIVCIAAERCFREKPNWRDPPQARQACCHLRMTATVVESKATLLTVKGSRLHGS